MKLRIGYNSRNQTMISPNPIVRTLFVALLGATVAGGCGGSASPKQEPEPQINPLAAMVGRPLVILPTQFLAFSTSSGEWESSADNPALLVALDEEIASTLKKRGVEARWTFAGEVAESARRNGGLTGDPYGLSAERFRRAKASDAPVSEPLGSQIRRLVAFRDARYALLPVELRIESQAGQGRAMLRLLLIDSRTARIVWADDVASARSAGFADARAALAPGRFSEIARDLAGRVADLVITQ